MKQLPSQGTGAVTRPKSFSELALVLGPDSSRKLGHGKREHMHSLPDVLDARELVGTVGPAVTTRDEDHSGRRDPGHEEAVVIGPAHHALSAEAELRGRCGDGRLDVIAACGGGVLVDHRDLVTDLKGFLFR